jgi:hypothetical protein
LVLRTQPQKNRDVKNIISIVRGATAAHTMTRIMRDNIAAITLNISSIIKVTSVVFA